MKTPLLVLAGAAAAALAPQAWADHVLFLGHSAYIEGVPAHLYERQLRGRGTYEDPFVLEEDYRSQRRYGDSRSLSPRDVIAILRERGFRSLSDVERFRAIYGVSATDPEGNRVRLAVDARTGAIRHARMISRARDDDRFEPLRVRPERRSPPRSAALPPARPAARPRTAPSEEELTTAAIDPSIEPQITLPPLPKARPAAPASATAAVEPPRRQTPPLSTMDPTGNTVRLPAPPAEPQSGGGSSSPTAPAATSSTQGGARPLVKYRPAADPSAPPAAELEEPGKNPLVVY